MPESPPVAPATPAPPVAPAAPATPSAPETKLAGKYATEADLLKGIGEARKTLGLKDDVQFGSIKDAETAYRDYDALINSRKPAPPSPQPSPAKSTTDLGIKPGETPNPVDDDLDIDGVLGKAGLKGEELAAAFVQDGKLEDSHYAALKAAGYPRKVVDQMVGSQIAIMTAKVEKAQAAAEQIAGGAEQHKQLREWAAANMPPAWLSSYSERIKKDPAAYVEMIEIVSARHARANGGGGNAIIDGSPSVPSSATAFATPQEMRAAMRESSAKFGDWSKDTALMKRMEATPRHIRSSIT